MAEPRDIFEAFKSSEEREKLASIKAEQMLDDKHIHTSVRELKFKANLGRLPEAPPDFQTLRQSKVHALSGLQELREQLKASQRRVVKADRTGMEPFLEVKKKPDLLEEDLDALSSVFTETQPIVKKKKKKNKSKRHHLELFDRSETNVLRQRFHQVRDKLERDTCNVSVDQAMEQLRLQ